MRLWILFWTPTLVFSYLDVQIVNNSTDYTISLTGDDRSVITEYDETRFKFNETILKDCVKNYLGGRPDNIFTHSPTPWGDLYKTYRWMQVRRFLKPVNSKIHEYTTTKVLINRDLVENNELMPSTFNINISFPINNNISVVGEKSELISSENFKMAVLIVDLKEKRSVTLDSKGKNQMTVVANVNVTLNTAQGMSVEIYAEKRVIRTSMEFEASLSGNIALNYGRAFRGHHFYGPNLVDIMQDCSIPTDIAYNTTFLMEFYEDPKLMVKDRDSGVILLYRRVKLVNNE